MSNDEDEIKNENREYFSKESDLINRIWMSFETNLTPWYDDPLDLSIEITDEFFDENETDFYMLRKKRRITAAWSKFQNL